MNKLTTAIVIALLVVVVPCAAKIPVFSLKELVHRADVICIARVKRIETLPDQYGNATIIKNYLTTHKILKGHADNEILIVTKKRHREDNLVIPTRGEMVLFLTREKDGTYRTVNSLQGLWPLADGIPQRMGLGMSIQQIVDEVKRQMEEPGEQQ